MSFLSRENRSPAEVPTLTVAFGPDIRVPQRSSAQLQNTGLICIFNDPNPFREITWVSYSLGRESNISLAVFSADGRLVRDLEFGPTQAGDYRVTWDGRDDSGRKTSRGIYYVRLSTEDQVHERKLVKTQ
ncbi:MAG: T9SS type A sorting domain-containing protein [candidate division WOR-3 bacterium]|nr:MAG: T9SS type A sorting domain-containing protein [candidate division WOR-3 bacterium]